MEKENAKKVLERASRLKDDLSQTQRKLRPVELDDMIANLGNPRMAEKLRIHKVLIIAGLVPGRDREVRILLF